METTDSAPGKKPPRNIYALFAADDVAQLKQRIEDKFGQDARLELKNGGWLVASELPHASAVFSQIDNREAPDLPCVIVKFDRYYGFQDAAIWDWVEAQRNGEY